MVVLIGYMYVGSLSLLPHLTLCGSVNIDVLDQKLALVDSAVLPASGSWKMMVYILRMRLHSAQTDLGNLWVPTASAA